MGKFKQFLNEQMDDVEDTEVVDLDTLSSEELLQIINDELALMDEDEISEFGYVLYNEFFDDEETEEDDYEDFSIEDVQAMIAELGAEFYIDVADLLLPEEDDEESEDDDVNEVVGRIMKRKKMNRKKRKFFKKTKADLRKGLSARRKANRLNKAKRKKYFRINKKRIQSYQKSRATAIKKGRHIKKVRKGA